MQNEGVLDGRGWRLVVTVGIERIALRKILRLRPMTRTLVTRSAPRKPRPVFRVTAPRATRFISAGRVDVATQQTYDMC